MYKTKLFNFALAVCANRIENCIATIEQDSDSAALDIAVDWCELHYELVVLEGKTDKIDEIEKKLRNNKRKATLESLINDFNRLRMMKGENHMAIGQKDLTVKDLLKQEYHYGIIKVISRKQENQWDFDYQCNPGSSQIKAFESFINAIPGSVLNSMVIAYRKNQEYLEITC